MRAYTDTVLPSGEPFRIELTLADGLRLTLMARLAWISELDEDDVASYEAGLQFVKVDPILLRLLEQRVSSCPSEAPDGF